MAQIFESEFGRLIRPGAYPNIKVQSSVSGLATTGVIALIGEADGGMPGASDSIEDNYFGPDEFAAVLSKYLSGPIVDGFRALVAASADPEIVGSVSRVYIYKTNASTQAEDEIINQGFDVFGVLADKNYGAKGNLIYWKVIDALAEIAPTTDYFSYMPVPATSDAAMDLRVNGDVVQSIVISALMPASTLAATLDACDGILCRGGVNRDILSGLSGKEITIAAAGNDATFTLEAGELFVGAPDVGDTLIIAKLGNFGAVANSKFKGAADKNYGAWMITNVVNTVTSAVITATKMRNDIVGALIAPESVGATTISANEDDLIVYSPIVIEDATGDDRQVLDGLVAVDASLTAVSDTITFALATGNVFPSTPQAGDLLVIPATSAYKGAGSANVGKFEIVSASNTAALAQIVAIRLSNGDPITVVTTSIVAVDDIIVLRPTKAGMAKSIEIMDGSGSEPIEDLFFQLGTDESVEWISSGADPVLITSEREQSVQMLVNRQLDNVQESFTFGGDIALKIGYLGTEASLQVTATKIITTVSGGAGAALDLAKADFPTLSDLATYINIQPGYAAEVGTTLHGQRSLDDLDLGTYKICSSTSAALYPGRVKRDLADIVEELDSSVLVSFEAEDDAAGLPDAMASYQYLSGGAKGGTTGLSIVNALTACEDIDANFIVPLFARDASDDILDGLTDSTSTYTIDAIHSAVKTHVLAMSQVKRRKNRQGFLAYQGSFDEARDAAQNMASHRLAMCFQDAKAGNAEGSVVQFQPWYTACNAAGMQAAGFYRAIIKKFMNVSGILQDAGDFSPRNDSQVENALLSGLLPAEKVATGGYRWISDQTTYGKDSNWIYNSIQATYVADVVARSLGERLENAFVGQTLGDVSAGIILSYIQAVMSEFLRLKLIAPSDDDAPAGYKNVSVQIQGNVAKVSLEIKVASALYFIPINITVSEITQSASI